MNEKLTIGKIDKEYAVLWATPEEEIEDNLLIRFETKSGNFEMTFGQFRSFCKDSA